MFRRFLRPSSLLARVASLFMIGGGAFLLVADSADCPKGHTDARFAATFVSTCPADVGPPEGSIEIVIDGGGPAPDTAIIDALRKAGFKPDLASEQKSGGDTCSTTGFSFQGVSGNVRYRCGVVQFDANQQDVQCTDATPSPTSSDAPASSRDPARKIDCKISLTKKGA